jgi:tetrahydromethanopterin S-methyltransferase subunit A
MISDPAGYFVIYVDWTRQLLSLEHYRNDGVLDTVVEGQQAAELYLPAIEQGLVSRLDHAAYLGRELARAEQALRSGERYVQDAGPDPANAALPAARGCSSACDIDMTAIPPASQRHSGPHQLHDTERPGAL